MHALRSPTFRASPDTTESAVALSYLLSAVSNYTLDALLDEEQRARPKQRCVERLSAQENVEMQYPEQAVLANLDWGMNTLEDAIATSDKPIKKAKLQHAEQLLHVCALLDPHQATVGMPNSYLAALAHSSLALVWKLRNDERSSAAHMVEMFLVEPLYSRTDFAPGLWEHLFLPHFTSILSWYSTQQHHILSSSSSSSSSYNLSYSDDAMDGHALGEPDNAFKGVNRKQQATQLQRLEQLYQDSMNENTRQFAQYYKDLLNFGTATRPILLALPGMDPLTTFMGQPSPTFGFSATNLAARIDNDAIPSTLMLRKEKSKQDDLSGEAEQRPRIVKAFKGQDEMEEAAHRAEGSVCNADYSSGHSTGYTTSSLGEPSEGSPPNKNSPSEGSPPTNKNSPSEGSPPNQNIPSEGSPPNQNIPSEGSPPNKNGPSEVQHGFHIKQSSPTSTSSNHKMLQKQRDCVRTAIGPEESNISGGEDVEALTGDNSEARMNENEKLQEDEEAKDAIEAGKNASSSIVVYTEELGQSPLQGWPDTPTPIARPPKDFICPITGQIFTDPVTLETGQTFERRVIREWINRGNRTCPITRQRLRSTSLPKANFVLKRVIASWKEQHPELASSEVSPLLPLGSYDSSQSLLVLDEVTPVVGGSLECLPSNGSSNNTNRKKGRLNQRFDNQDVLPVSPLTNAAIQDSLHHQHLLDELKPAIDCLCNSHELEDCEAAVLTIAQLWQESEGNESIQVHLTEERVVKGFLEVLSTSSIGNVLAATLYILSEIIYRDGMVSHTVAREDPDYNCVIGLLKRGLLSATVVLCQLKPTSSQLAFFDLLPSLVCILSQCESEEFSYEDPFPMFMGPKEAAVLMIDRMLAPGDDDTKSVYAHCILSRKGLSSLVDSLEANSLDERIGAVSILLCCMQADGNCRNYIAHRAQLTPILALLHSCGERARLVATFFLSELVRHNRRSINNQLLQVIREEGSFSTMHLLLAQLQIVSVEQRPVIAGLLLQLDLLAHPRKGSIYREESIEALIGALSDQNVLSSQVAAAETVISLGGRFSCLGRPLMGPLLLKRAGLDQIYNGIIRAEQEAEDALPMDQEDEEAAAKEWEMRVAGSLVGFEMGTILEALARGMNSQAKDLSKPCKIAVTWLVHMLPLLSDIGVQEKARNKIMPEFVYSLKFSEHIEDRALALLGLYYLIDDSEGVQELLSYAKDICAPLRQLKLSLWMARDILKKLIDNSSVFSPEFWTHEDLGAPADASMNGEVRCLAHLKGRLFSGHSDGTLKVWYCKKKNLTLLQDAKEHSKSVTCMYISPSGSKLYTGSVDKTIKMWSIRPEGVHCLESHDTKEPVHCLVTDSTVFSPFEGMEFPGDAVSKPLLGNKHVRSFAVADGKLFCGYTDYSIQEVDLSGKPPLVIQQGVRTLRGKKAIYGIQVFNDKLYAAGSLVDGVAAKVWSLKDKSLVGQLTTSSDIRALAVSDDFIYLGSSSGSVEVWLRERLFKVSTMSASSKVNCLLVLDNVLYCGSEDGKIRRWALS